LKKKELFHQVLNLFRKHNPEADTELIYTNPYELLVAVILSAQCTDVRVNAITPNLFAAFPDPQTLAASSPETVYALIKSCSYPNNKAKHLVAMAEMLVDQFKGVVPDDIDLLQKLPGVGRKTANVIASVVYNKPAMAVDTHVFRVASRIGLTHNAKTPLDAELQLVKFIPENDVPRAHHWLILHGRYVCKARRPLCEKCFLRELCNHYNTSVKPMPR
jgi:endonuclease III